MRNASAVFVHILVVHFNVLNAVRIRGKRKMELCWLTYLHINLFSAFL